MKFWSIILFLACFFVSSDLIQTESKSVTLTSLLSPREKIVHDCLQKTSNDMSCFKNASLAPGNFRTPSSEANTLISNNQWFFFSESKKLLTFRFIQGLMKTHSSIRKDLTPAIGGRGVSVVGEVFFGIGGSWIAEVVKNGNMLGLFCAPGVVAYTDVGLNLGLSLVRTLSCKNNAEYSGGFLTFGAGVSAEMIGLPIGLGLSYSFGFKAQKLVDAVRAAKSKGEFNSKEIARELATLKQISAYNYLIQKYGEEGHSAASILYFGTMALTMVDPSILLTSITHFPDAHHLIKSAWDNKTSAGRIFQELHQSEMLQELFESNKLPHLRSFFGILSAALSGCDAINTSGSLSATVSPISVGIGYNNYKLLHEMPFEDLSELQSITAFSLLNPFVLQVGEMRAVLKIAKVLMTLPAQIKNECGPDEIFKFNRI